MDMMKIKIAGLSVEIKIPDKRLASLCAPYQCQEPAHFKIDVSQEEFAAEMEVASASGCPEWEVFGLATYRKLCLEALDYDCILFHSSAVEVKGKGYLFAGPSGTGKSTHSQQWIEMLGSSAMVINDDKPLLRLIDNVWFVCGTPWNGKHRLGCNRQVPIAGICFLEQSDYNGIFRIDKASAIPRLLNQMLRPSDLKGMDRLLGLMESLLEQIPMWRMEFLPDLAAAEICYGAMKGDRE